MDERCPTCGSEDVVLTGPLTVESGPFSVVIVRGKQCTLCGNLQVMIPQSTLVKMYPPGLRYLTEARRTRLQHRRQRRGRVFP